MLRWKGKHSHRLYHSTLDIMSCLLTFAWGVWFWANNTSLWVWNGCLGSYQGHVRLEMDRSSSFIHVYVSGSSNHVSSSFPENSKICGQCGSTWRESLWFLVTWPLSILKSKMNKNPLPFSYMNWVRSHKRQNNLNPCPVYGLVMVRLPSWSMIHDNPY